MPLNSGGWKCKIKVLADSGPRREPSSWLVHGSLLAVSTGLSSSSCEGANPIRETHTHDLICAYSPPRGPTSPHHHAGLRASAQGRSVHHTVSQWLPCHGHHSTRRRNATKGQRDICCMVSLALSSLKYIVPLFCRILFKFL